MLYNFLRPSFTIVHNQLECLSREVLLKGRLSTVDLLVLTSFDQLLFILKILFNLFSKISYLNEEANSTEPSPSVRIPLFVPGSPF
jgi:hypothetical protein